MLMGETILEISLLSDWSTHDTNDESEQLYSLLSLLWHNESVQYESFGKLLKKMVPLPSSRPDVLLRSRVAINKSS